MSSRVASSSATSSPRCSAGGEQPFGGAAAPAPRSGRDQHASIELDLEEAHRGTVRNLTLQQAGRAGSDRRSRADLARHRAGGRHRGPVDAPGRPGRAGLRQGPRRGPVPDGAHPAAPQSGARRPGREADPAGGALGSRARRHAHRTDAGRSGGPAHPARSPSRAAGCVCEAGAWRATRRAISTWCSRWCCRRRIRPAARELYERMRNELAFDPRASL